ncbi:hypothetical protein F4680DRAFT_442490 [Xylaria scruposa]|nr:hypothetical protein F4680DRAFT_442490 [Xylaria scruposa]
MTTHSNSSPADGEIERAGRGSQPDISNITRIVRDITYKVIPSCSLFLVIFSTGAVITSTFSFDKPIPRHGTIVISSLLLSLFVLFLIGFVYLRFRESWPHESNQRGCPGLSQQTSPSDSNDHSKNKRAPATIISNIEMTNYAGPQGSEGRIFPSDELRDPAPSPNTYRKQTEEHQDAIQGQNMVYELPGSTPQQDRYPAQRYVRQVNETSRPGPSNLVRDGDSEAHQLFSGERHSRPIPESMASKIYVTQTSSRPSAGDIRKTTRQFPPVGDLGRSSAVTGNIYQTVGIQDYRGLPVQHSLPTREPQYQAYVPSPLSSQASVRIGPRQVPSPLSETSAWSTGAPRSPPTNISEQRGCKDPANAFPWPSGRSLKTGMQDGKALPRPIIQLDGQSSNLPLNTPGKRPMGPRPMNRGQRFPVNTREGTVNSAISNRGPNPLRSEQAGPESSHQSHSDVQFRRKSIPLNIASSLNGIHQETTSNNKSSAFPFPAPISIPEYSRFPAAAPRPLQLPDSDYHCVPPIPTSYTRRKTTPQPRPASHELPIIEVEEETTEVPKIPVRALGREKTKGLRGGGAQHRPRVPLRGNSRKFKRKNSQYWSRLGYRIKSGNIISDSVQNNVENEKRSL